MSGIPSDAAGSILQTGLQQNAVSGAQDNERNRAANIAAKAAQKADQRQDDVVGDESDMAVNPDGGTGGQGRSFSEAPNEEETATGETEADETKGITVDENGQTHLDLEA